MLSDFLSRKQTIPFPGKLASSSIQGVGKIADYTQLAGDIGETTRIASDQAGTAGVAAGAGEALGDDRQVFDSYSVRDFIDTAARIGVDSVGIDTASQHGANTVATEEGVIYIRINPERMAEVIARNDGDIAEILGTS